MRNTSFPFLIPTLHAIIALKDVSMMRFLILVLIVGLGFFLVSKFEDYIRTVQNEDKKNKLLVLKNFLHVLLESVQYK